MKIALAQIPSQAARVSVNAALHRRSIAAAKSQAADWVIFPELSLTGYEPDLAEGLAVAADDPCWDAWQEVADELNISFALGMPLRSLDGMLIGQVIFRPQQPHQIYGKQYLHPDEEAYFVPATGYKTYWPDEAIAPAICYEISIAGHAAAAAANTAEIYLASVAKFERGIAPAHQNLAGIARQYGMLSLMVNAIGAADGGVCTGQSAAWNRQGKLIHQLPADAAALLIVDTQQESAAEYPI